MERIKYYFAAVYQSIKSRRPDGTPYSNLCLGITGALLLNLMGALMMLKVWFHKNLITDSETTFLIWFISLAVSIMFLLRFVFPIDDIRDIEVDKKDIKLMNFLFFAYFMLSIAFVMTFLVLNGRITH